MPKCQDELELTEQQVLYFRATSCHLTGDGASDPAAAARAILGAQAQVQAPGLLALSQRTAGRPTAAALEENLLHGGRDLVRTWGQRDTLHIYDAATDWALVLAARGRWAPAGRGNTFPAEQAVDATLKIARAAGRPITRRDVMHLVPAEYMEYMATRVGEGEAAVRAGAGRLLWRLCRRGDLCVAGKMGSEQTYATREAWHPGLDWTTPAPPPRDAALELARRYLGSYGPATAQDMAHFFGARVTEARTWLERLQQADGLVQVCCGQRKGLVALSSHREALQVEPPTGLKGWPVRLLPTWDCLLMGHADKSWTVPDEGERKAVWRKAAMVAAVLLARGRVVATWTQKKRRGDLEVTVTPLGAWRKSKHAAGARREARAVAAHLGLGGAELVVL